MKTFMKFSQDMFYDSKDVPIYNKGKVYEIPENMVARWLKRGGEIVVAPVVPVEPEPLDLEQEFDEDADMDLDGDDSDVEIKKPSAGKPTKIKSVKSRR
jgi:hypothetical protein